MTQSSADKTATIVMGVAAAAAAYYILKTPDLRRLAWRMAVAAATGTIPAWLTHEIREGWEASGAPVDTVAAVRGQARAV